MDINRARVDQVGGTSCHEISSRMRQEMRRDDVLGWHGRSSLNDWRAGTGPCEIMKRDVPSSTATSVCERTWPSRFGNEDIHPNFSVLSSAYRSFPLAKSSRDA